MNIPEALPTCQSQWGEGPVWWKDHLYYVDIQGRALIRFSPDTREEKVRELDQRIGFALPCADGRWIWGGDHGLYFLDLSTGESTFITDPETHLPENRFNDAGISPDGRLFAGTIATHKQTGAASLYRMDADTSCRLVYPHVTNSNGIGWSPDGKTCYYIDTPSHNIRSFEYHADTGEISNEQILFNTEGRIQGVPDGMCVDAENKLWIAFCHGGCVIRFHPENGEILNKIDFPAIETTSCCFGGPELKDLYVTTGQSAGGSEEHAGKVFVVRNAGNGIEQVPFTAKESL